MGTELLDRIKALTGIDVTIPPPPTKTQAVKSNRDKAGSVLVKPPIIGQTAGNPLPPASVTKNQLVTTASDSQPNVKHTQIHKPGTISPTVVASSQNCDITSVPHAVKNSGELKFKPTQSGTVRQSSTNVPYATDLPKKTAINSREPTFDQSRAFQQSSTNVPHATDHPKKNALNSCVQTFDQSRAFQQSSTHVPHATNRHEKDAKNNGEPKYEQPESKGYHQGSHGPDLTATPTRPKHHQLTQPNQIPGAHAFDLVDIASPTTTATPLSSSVQKKKMPVLDHDDVKVRFSSTKFLPLCCVI